MPRQLKLPDVDGAGSAIAKLQRQADRATLKEDGAPEQRTVH
ncbi:MAG: hypothetical protein AAF915_06300 [Cyanobacteria bacterium P01_D01_bin.50]